MDIYSRYATDITAEEEGRWFDFGAGIEFLIARQGNTRYNRILAQQYEAHKHTLDLETTGTPEQQKAAKDRSHRIMAEVMAKSILLGWRVKEGAPEGTQLTYKGQAAEYSVANAEKLLLIKDFQADVDRKARDFNNFRVKLEEADAKNLLPTSTGTSSGETKSSTLKD